MELKWIESDSLYPQGHHGHNVHFLIHALNLGGRYDESMKWVQHLFTFKENPRERSGNNQRGVWRQGYFGLIKTVVRFEKWDAIQDGTTIPVYDKPEQQAWWMEWREMRAAKTVWFIAVMIPAGRLAPITSAAITGRTSGITSARNRSLTMRGETSRRSTGFPLARAISQTPRLQSILRERR